MRMAQIGRGHGHDRGKWQAMSDNTDVEAVGWFDSVEDASTILADPRVVAVSIESRNHRSLAMAETAIDAGKHLWFDKPAGDDWPRFERLMRRAAEQRLHV